MTILKIGTTDIFLDDFDNGRGKITISDWDKGAFTYYWSSMGCDLLPFIKDINADYFADKLCVNRTIFDSELTVKNVRRNFRDVFKSELPWYLYPTAQKELREAIKELEYCTSPDEFIHKMNGLVDGLWCSDLSYEDEKEFKGKLGDFFSCEPWLYICTSPSNDYKWLVELHKKIKKL